MNLGGRATELGANLATVYDNGMLIEFHNEEDVLWDSNFVEGPAGGNPASANGNDLMVGTAETDYLWGLYGDDTLVSDKGAVRKLDRKI